MSTQLAEMSERQDAFDVRLTTLEEKFEAEASMRAAMAQDISDIKIEQRAQRGMLQAVGVTLSEHSARLSGVETRLDRVETRLDRVEDRLSNVDTRLGNVETRLGNVETRLDRVEHGLGTVQVGVQTIIAMLDRKTAGEA
jgi:chromosome segregation ATPase